jgi:hypothetical protein
MKKQIAIFLFLMTLMLATQIPIGMAFQMSYDWNIPNGVGGYNKYQLSLITADSWQVDTTIDITFRLTLISKSSMLDHTETNWVEVVLSSENFIMNSGNQTEIVTLTNVGNYWEKKVSFYIPAEKLNRGQTLKVSIFLIVSINEIDSVQKLSQEYNANNYYNIMSVNLIRPILSTLELIVMVVVAVIVIIGISGFILYRRRRVSVKPPTLQSSNCFH